MSCTAGTTVSGGQESRFAGFSGMAVLFVNRKEPPSGGSPSVVKLFKRSENVHWLAKTILRQPERRQMAALFPLTWYGSLLQYNQHEVDNERAANTLFDGILTNSQFFAHLSKHHHSYIHFRKIG